MFEKLNRRSLAVPLVVLAATLGVGGTALAASGTSNAPSASTATSQVATGNTATPATGQSQVATPPTQQAADVPTAGDKADNATDVPTAGDKADGMDHGNEIANGDGPTGHADEASAQR